VSVGVAVQAMLGGMPLAADLRRTEVDGEVLIAVGQRVLFRFEVGDGGLRNLAAVTLPELGFTARRVAEVLGITEEYVSMLRARVRRDGSAALMRRKGRPPALGERQLATARAMRADGRPDTAIAGRLGVSAATIVRALGRREQAPADPDAPAAEQVRFEQDTPHDGADGQPASADTVAGDDGAVGSEAAAGTVAVRGAVAVSGGTEGGQVAARCRPVGLGTGLARLDQVQVRSRYAGVMLLHAYLHRVGAEAVFATVAGGPARRYDDLAVLTCATIGFALGIDTVEGSKHLRRAEAGAVVGLAIIPELATLRGRLGALADGGDPLALQRSFAAGMLTTDPAADPVFFVDDHFVPYSGAQPVGKGWNTKRRHAQPGRDDTLLVDARGRAVVFGSGEPSGLSSTLPGVLAQLRQVLGPDAPVLLGFDRGGAYPSAFNACRAAGAHWVTYRRAPLVQATAVPRRSWTVRDGKRISVTLADESVQLKGYGAARQLTLFEHDKPVLQVLTSDTTATGAALLCWLRARWRIENMFKYAAEHNGIDALADYAMDISPDTRKVPNPARLAARKTVAAAEAELALAERALPQLLAGPGTLTDKNRQLPGAHRRIQTASRAVQAAKTALQPVPAKVLATDLDPDAQRARPRLQRRGLQMVLRLLAFNAEAWLAEHFNAYLADPDEYRAIVRQLLHLGGQVHYTSQQITVTLDRPDSPRVARTLELLTQELNATPARLPGDRRPLTYQVTPA
jgi:hypothetical protein